MTILQWFEFLYLLPGPFKAQEEKDPPPPPCAPNFLCPGGIGLNLTNLLNSESGRLLKAKSQSSKEYEF